MLKLKMTITSVILSFHKNPIFLHDHPVSPIGSIVKPAYLQKSQKNYMKKIFTNLFRIIILITTSLISLSSNAQSGNGGGNGNGNSGVTLNVSFTATPVLMSGTALTVGAKYKFSNVATNVNAIVTIVSATNGATVTNLDDNTLTKPEAFSPVISIPAHSNGLVEFKIEYFANNFTTPKVLDTLRATAMDIDGNSTLHEVDVIDMGSGATAVYASSSTEISISKSGTAYIGTNIAGNEYTAVDTAAKQVMFTVTNKSISSFVYKAGANNTGNSAVSRQKGIYFKGFNYPQQTIVVPVKYISFSGTAANKAVLLSWVTSQEINNDHYEVERSTNGKDFSVIGMVLDGFESNGNMSYAFKDNAAMLQDQTVVYYRLKQVDTDGRFSYSNVIAIRLKAAASDLYVEVAPNPFTEKVIVRFNSEAQANAEIRITNLAGQTIVSKKMTVNKGYNNLQVDGLSALPSGVYVASLITDGKVTGTQKIVK